MSSCGVSIPSVPEGKSDLKVSEKYLQLMQDTLSDDGLYVRAKETLFQQFKDLQITEEVKAKIVAEFVSKFSIDMSAQAMNAAIAWAKEERDGGWALALAEAKANLTAAETAKITEEIGVIEKDIALKCAQVEATIASSLRENGAVALYDSENQCKPLILKNEGLKYYQTKQVQADSYRIAADTYRKSGVVDVGSKRVLNTAWVDDGQGTDPDASGQPKYLDEVVMIGISGNTHKDHGELAGYTAQQTANAERQRIAYEDSKVNHAANSSASMIGQMLSAEVMLYDGDVEMWRSAVQRLLKPYTTTPIP